jgi:deoxyribodipyrimidine photolyase-like uncharacterized protein
VLGDQLSHSLSSLADRSPADTVVLMMEVWDETQYVRHHKAKIALIFSAMRHFAEELRERGFTVDTSRSTIQPIPAVSPAKWPARPNATRRAGCRSPSLVNGACAR